MYAFHLGAGLTKMPLRLLELPANRTKLEPQTVCFGLPKLQIVRNVRIERQEKVGFRLRSRLAIRNHRVRRFGHDLPVSDVIPPRPGSYSGRGNIMQYAARGGLYGHERPNTVGGPWPAGRT